MTLSELEQVKKLLIKNNQTKILGILEKIEGREKEELEKQIIELDFDQINRLYKNREVKWKKSEKIEPIKYIDKNKLNEEERKEILKLSEQVIRQGQYAVVTMAGGQGTRLGWKGPKGTFKLNIGENGKYIFEILVDTLKRASKKFETEPYWYIMTSVDNNNDTIKFFEDHNFFGYQREKVKFFTQNVLPLMDFEGNLLVDKNFKLKEASDGNGGVYRALQRSGMIDDMKIHDIKWVYIGGVDNIMANMVDDVLLGLAIKHNVPSASKSVKKAYPEEKVGIFCKRNGKPAIIEYIDMNEEMIYAKDENDELLYGESNILAHLFNIESLEKIAKYHLDYHCATKKNSYVDENLNEVVPEKLNTYKFEAFIFDAFEYLDDMIILRVNREEEFAPIKNATGIDSPETAKNIYEEYFSKTNYCKA